jgi:uncharacterized membrane protein
MRARVIAVGVAAVAYVLGSHWLMTGAPASPWNAVLVVGPMLAGAAFLAWQRGQRWLGMLAALATAALIVQAWRGGGLAPGSLYVAQHVAIHVLLAFAFGLTLQAGRKPLVSALARRVHGGLTRDMEIYSRKVTVAWTIYFGAMARGLARALRLCSFRRVGDLRQPGDAAGDAADVRRRVPAALSAAPGVRAGDARAGDARLRRTWIE